MAFPIAASSPVAVPSPSSPIRGRPTTLALRRATLLPPFPTADRQRPLSSAGTLTLSRPRRIVSSAGTSKALDAVAAVVAPSVALTAQHGYVALVLVAAIFVHNFYMSFAVGAARRKFDVKYPAMYASGDSTDANLFNCTQRGHQNSLESLPSFLALLLIAGIKYPITAAIAGAVYTLGKVVYFNAYSSGDPNKRMQGAFSYLGLFTLMGCVIRFGISLITG